MDTLEHSITQGDNRISVFKYVLFKCLCTTTTTTVFICVHAFTVLKVYEFNMKYEWIYMSHNLWGYSYMAVCSVSEWD